MAELSDPIPVEEGSSCCSPAAQETCCEPGEKAACCDTAAAGGSCGCDAGELRETVRARYAAAALATTDAAIVADEQCFGRGLYADGERDELPEAALTHVPLHVGARGVVHVGVGDHV